MSHIDVLTERYTTAAHPARTTAPTIMVIDERALTPREYAVLVGIAAGRSYAEIAAEQHISSSTVKSAAKRAYRKLGARCAAHAVHIGWQRGLLGPSTAPSTPVEARGG